MEEAGAVSGVLAALTPTGVSQERLSRLLHGLGTSSRLSSFLFWLKAPVQRPIRRGGGGDRRSLRYKRQPSISELLLLSPPTPPTSLLGNEDNWCSLVSRNLPTSKTLGPMTVQSFLSDSGDG